MEKAHNIKRGISLFSFQEKYYTGEMSLEDCIATVSKLGVRGIEMLPDQMIPGYPSISYNLSDEFVVNWHEWMAKYDTEPISLDVYGETKVYKNRMTTHKEILDQLIDLMRVAKKLNFKIVRLTFHLPIEVIEMCIPYAEELDIKIAVEAHAPHILTSEWVNKNIELAQKKGTKHFGIMPDLGTFSKTIPRVVINESLRHGGQDHITEYIDNVYKNREIPSDLVEKVTKMGANSVDIWLAQRVVIGVWTYHDPKYLLEFMPYITHIHGKFYEMNDDNKEPDVDYENVMPYLIEGGYSGYIMSEYEGQRLTQDIDTGYDEVEQVRRHQEMLKSYLEKTQSV
ncbi:TIM barrel protein [Alkalihalobacillus sp. MEB130]|uniref:sugar phosphate isomerase/epimerase family protein n=1 Tax=Alkalihalobacillus sp. MEB130 TaxID=2976704 RepID=UPI0028DF4652|nr:TIM barrel protein [Alkalihalobacillus sp. MEB130]MDT8860208.1 TIM barrel protein [Alkalihalobacillus sp. MEB130]